MGKKILQDVCTELSYLLEHRNSSSRTTDNVVMEITLTSVFRLFGFSAPVPSLPKMHVT